MSTPIFNGRVGLQQRVLPVYRRAFFDALARACGGGLSVFAGEPRARESIASAASLEEANFVLAHNVHLLSGPAYLCFQRGLLDWLERWSPDVLIIEANPRYLSSPAGAAWMHRKGKAVIGWGLGAAGQGGFFSQLRRTARRRFLANFDAVIAYSQQGAMEFEELGVDPGGIFVAGNAVSEPPDAIVTREALLDRPARILFVGRLQARKRVDVLLQACADLNSPVALRIVGGGPERERLERLAGEIFPAAEFTGPMYGDALRDCFAWADLFVLPGTGGLAVQEAMAYGLPVIVAEGDGTERDLISADNGWIVPVNDPAALTSVIGTALSEPAQLEQMGARSYTLVRDRFNIEHMTEIFVQAMNRVRVG